MSSRRWTRRLVIAGIWALVASTWGSIGHHLIGLPDPGAVLPVMAAGTVLVWPVRVHGIVPKARTAARVH